MFKTGYRWKVGDGESINVWLELWLGDSSNPKLETTIDPQLGDLKVVDLFIPGTQLWDVELISSLFIPRDAKAILNIPLHGANPVYMRIWHFRRSKRYTVKSSYKLATKVLTSNARLYVKGDWANLWQL